jgi:hypothetical protein
LVVGEFDGFDVGLRVGEREGLAVGDLLVGHDVGLAEGAKLGTFDGMLVGGKDGH